MENKLTKKMYRKLILRDLFLESKSTWVMLALYAILWRVMYTISNIGQLKTNIPLFLGISLLLFLFFSYKLFVYRKQMKKDYLFQPNSQIEIQDSQVVIRTPNTTEEHTLDLQNLAKLKENKKWYLLYFADHTFLPLSKDTVRSFEQKVHVKAKQLTWKWPVLLVFVITAFGAYKVGENAVNYNGALAWKLSELKTDTKLKLENDNFYVTRLDGLLDLVKEKIELEPLLMTNDLEINFEQDGTITSIYMFIYGYDESETLQFSYLIYYDEAKDDKLTVHKQDWDGDGQEVYNQNNDLSIVSNMLESIPLEKEVTRWGEENNGVLYKGIRNWGGRQEGIVFINKNGEIRPPSDTEITGPSISLYVPGKEETITPLRYVYRP
ncbi:hypothetical protein KO561_12090 [Radiobacillus kanasensis]|uniref:hypothetical protein n=1 Tax=Radiobacillus kanasensis TaxID=2844358 RepID=UPI001E39EE58|nr:hypothetical protein [Radiobacillus kanasensis]UFT97947.1 hypothetical protein KO561_12090 [Radiobacillus kanasensis]